MPYAGIPSDMTDKMDECVNKVMGQGKDKESAIAICHDSLMGNKTFVLDGFIVDVGVVKAISPREDMADQLVVYGDAVKALGGGKLGGYLIRFGSLADTDLEGDYFDKSTDFGDAPASDVYYHHGLDAMVGKRTLGKGQLKPDDTGVWIEAQLALRDDYEKAIYAMAEKGKLGWSSGTAAHLIEREGNGKAHHIKKWPLGFDASLTPTPAEPRNGVIPIKSLKTMTLDVRPDPKPEPARADAQAPTGAKADASGATAEGAANVSNASDSTDGLTNHKSKGQTTEEQAMSDELKAMLAEGLTPLSDAVKAIGEKVNQLEGILKKEPGTKAGTQVTVTEDPADRPFLTIADECKAIKAYATGEGMHPRLKGISAMKAPSGATVGVSSEGGFLVEPQIAAGLLQPIHDVAPFSSRAQRVPVSGPSNSGWLNGVDETNRATGSRWGGVQGYRVAEGFAPTATKPKFRRINWELKKYAALVYGSDELLADAAQFATVVNTACSEELSFMVNDDIFEGLGVAGCVGILNAGCTVSVSKESGQPAGTIQTKNLSKMWSRMDSRSKANAAWFINTDCNPQLDELSIPTGVAALEPRFVTYGSDGLLRIKGKPVIETEYNSTIGTVGDIVLADMTQYLQFEKGGVQAAESIHVLFTTDETAFRFIYRTDGQPVLASAITPFKGTSNTVSPFVTLATRA